jgi:arylsulfatase A-like enzyme
LNPVPRAKPAERTRPPLARTIGRAVIVAILVLAVWIGVRRVSELGVEGDAPRRRVSGVVLICVDTLRADVLEPDASGARPMPELERFADGGARFAGAVAPTSWTGPSLATVLTGLIPLRHGLTDPTDDARIPAAVPTLATVLRAAGWSTWASTGGGWAGTRAGVDLGFDRFGEDFDDHPPADTITKWAGARRKDRPFLLLLHTYAAHDPYGDRELVPAKRCAPEEIAEATSLAEKMRGTAPSDNPGVRREFIQRWLSNPCSRNALDQALGKRACWEYWQGCLAWMNGGFLATDDDRDLVRRLGESYRVGLAYVDRRIAQTLAALAAQPAMNDVAVVIFGDHGEAFGEHGVAYHGSRITEELARVPLFLRAPGVSAGVVVDASCGLVDVMPTLLDLAGVAPPADLDGRSLRPLLDRRRGEDRDAGPVGWPVESFVRPLSEMMGADDGAPRWVSVRDASATWLASFDHKTSTWASESWFDRRADVHEQSPLPTLPPGVGDKTFRDAVARARSRIEQRYGKR